jgi:hypothetical protein
MACTCCATASAIACREQVQTCHGCGGMDVVETVLTATLEQLICLQSWDALHNTIRAPPTQPHHSRAAVTPTPGSPCPPRNFPRVHRTTAGPATHTSPCPLHACTLILMNTPAHLSTAQQQTGLTSVASGDTCQSQTHTETTRQPDPRHKQAAAHTGNSQNQPSTTISPSVLPP